MIRVVGGVALAWTAFSTILAVAIIGVWVRSYFVVDAFQNQVYELGGAPSRKSQELIIYCGSVNYIFSDESSSDAEFRKNLDFVYQRRNIPAFAPQIGYLHVITEPASGALGIHHIVPETWGGFHATVKGPPYATQWTVRTAKLPLKWPAIIMLIPPAIYFWRRWRRRPLPGRCRCGYDLTGNSSGVCPECGAAVEPMLISRSV